MTTPTELVWQNGRLGTWSEAVVHVMAHGLHYGSTVFEGIRSYATDNGPAIFRLREHIERLFDSSKMYRIEIPFTIQQIEEGCCQVVRANGLTDAYIRPLVYRDVGGLGLVPGRDDPVGVAICAIKWGPLFGQQAVENGIDVCVSSWHRLQSSSTPVMAKAGGHYLTSQLISMEAKLNGYAEGIAVNQAGIVTEGAGSNLFLIRRGQILTPSMGCSILEGITRDTVMCIAGDEKLKIVENDLPRESLYIADEIFLCGTASEITPVTSVDRIQIGDGKPGPITRRLQNKFRAVVSGTDGAKYGWLSYLGSSAGLITTDGKRVRSAGTLAY